MNGVPAVSDSCGHICSKEQVGKAELTDYEHFNKTNMSISVVKITQISENPNNPRSIEPEALERLVGSILAFPKMLELRPIVVDELNTALGGNMRIQALNAIAGMTIEQITERLNANAGYTAKPGEEKEEIVEYWAKWLSKKTAYIVRASELTEGEKNQFVVKDNVSYGEWDTEGLKDIDNGLLQDWGVDMAINPAGATQSTKTGKTPVTPEKVETEIPQDALPEELQGVDMEPDKMEEYESTEDTKFDYIAISYKEAEREKVAEALKVDAEKLFSKVCWNIDDYILLRKRG